MAPLPKFVKRIGIPAMGCVGLSATLGCGLGSRSVNEGGTSEGSGDAGESSFYGAWHLDHIDSNYGGQQYTQDLPQLYSYNGCTQFSGLDLTIEATDDISFTTSYDYLNCDYGQPGEQVISATMEIHADGRLWIYLEIEPGIEEPALMVCTHTGPALACDFNYSNESAQYTFVRAQCSSNGECAVGDLCVLDLCATPNQGGGGVSETTN